MRPAWQVGAATGLLILCVPLLLGGPLVFASWATGAEPTADPVLGVIMFLNGACMAVTGYIWGFTFPDEEGTR